MTDVLEYFRSKASHYDDVDDQVYWRLSDAVLWDFLEVDVLPLLPANFRFFDAGCGTGRWALRLLHARDICTGILMDFCPDMLHRARFKLQRAGMSGRVTLIEDDLRSTSRLPQGCDLAISFHNVFGFIHDAERLLKNLHHSLAAGGILAIVAPNIFHAVYFNLKLGRLTEARLLLKRRFGRFTERMPLMRFFDPAELQVMSEHVGFKTLANRGFPVSVYPGQPETGPSTSSPDLVSILSSKPNFSKVLLLEKQLCRHQTAARGNNLFLLARKK